ncbi:DUF418 domain-containing protein [Nonomuraea jabiensis]|uniref:DUF418 domain-containing protein n=1 Tax=Nonomuraea jabiensis TaxID=882448 RepID=UPI003D75408A
MTNYLTATLLVLAAALLIGGRPQEWASTTVITIGAAILIAQWPLSAFWLRRFRQEAGRMALALDHLGPPPTPDPGLMTPQQLGVGGVVEVQQPGRSSSYANRCPPSPSHPVRMLPNSQSSRAEENRRPTKQDMR